MVPTLSRAWGALKSEGDSLAGEGFAVRARTQDRSDELWVNVRLPDGSWSYAVFGPTGAVLTSRHGTSKAQTYLATLEARGNGDHSARDHLSPPMQRS
jgi:hypothetical protein